MKVISHVHIQSSPIACIAEIHRCDNRRTSLFSQIKTRQNEIKTNNFHTAHKKKITANKCNAPYPVLSTCNILSRHTLKAVTAIPNVRSHSTSTIPCQQQPKCDALGVSWLFDWTGSNTVGEQWSIRKNIETSSHRCAR
jgi:hypothetical protein